MTAERGFAVVLDRLERVVLVLEVLAARIDFIEDRLDQLDRDGARLKELAWAAPDGSRLN
jgi:hypothetical protein